MVPVDSRRIAYECGECRRGRRRRRTPPREGRGIVYASPRRLYRDPTGLGNATIEI